MIAAVHQPQFLPWLGYFDKMMRADTFCYLDNVQFKKNEFQNRNRIKTSNGWQWITVPVLHRFTQKINEVEINNTVKWRRKHLRSLVANYGKTPFFRTCIPFFEHLYSEEWKTLSELNIMVIEHFRKILGMEQKPVVQASTLDLSDEPTDRLIDICESLGADTYLAGEGAGAYMNFKRFEKRGIRLAVQRFHHPEYPQIKGPFLSNMSIVDLLFNCGPGGMKNTVTSWI